MSLAPSPAPTRRVLIADYGRADISAEIPYLFAKASCTVDVFCPSISWLLYSSYFDTWIPAANDNAAVYAAQLMSLVETKHYDWVVLADDFVVRIMNEAITDEALARKILPLSKLENRVLLGSKAGLSVLCERHGIRTPRFAVYVPDVNLEVLVAEVSFPLLVKIDRSSGGEGVFLCANEQQLKATLEGRSDSEKERLIFQQYINGDTVAVEALYKEGALLAYGYSTVRTTVRDEFGASIERSYSECPAIEPALSHIGEAFGLDGFCNMTFIRDRKDSEHHLVEADLRPQAWFRLAILCGVDFSMAIRNHFSDTRTLLRPALPPHEPCLRMCHFSRDLVRCIDEGDANGAGRWLVNSGDCWRFIPWYDRRVFYATLRSVAGHAFWRYFRRFVVR